LFYQQTSDRRKRQRHFDNLEFAPNEENAPLNAPRWTKSGYKGSLVKTIKKAALKYNDNIGNDDNYY
jgi:hypothetical protein